MSTGSLLDVNEKTFDKSRYFLQAHRIKLQDYIKRALIAPDKYMGSEKETDLQSKNKDYLTLSHGYIQKLDETQVLIEIILTEDEKQRLIQQDDIYFSNTPLPISRIKKIYTQDKKTIEHILNSIATSEAGYIPLGLFDTFKAKDFKSLNQFSCKSFEDYNDNVNIIDHNNKITKYNNMLGMLAFMKNTNMYYADDKGIFSNYSDNYFKILASFNKIFGDDAQKVLTTIKEDKKFADLLLSNDSMNDEFITKLISRIDDDEVKQIFTNLINEPNYKKKALEQLQDKDEIYYYICLVYNHKQKDSNRKDSFKLNISSSIPFEKAEIALACLGSYYGYTNIRRSEKIEIADKYFKKLIDKDNFVNMKFKLDSKLDLITIETIYRYVFDDNKVQNEEFDYLSYPKSKKNIVIPKEKEFKTFYEVEQKDYFDTKYIKINKLSLQEIIINKLAKYKEIISFGDSYLSNFIAKYFKSLIKYSKDGKPCEPYCNKDDFLAKIDDETIVKKQNELLEVFMVDKK
jgi:hypothetical protein